MKPTAARASAVLALLLAGFAVVQAQMKDKASNLDLLSLLSNKPWLIQGPHNRWDRSPSFHFDMDSPEEPKIPMDDVAKIYSDDDDLRLGSEKRSGLATALNFGRRRRESTQTFGLLNNVGSFFDTLRDSLQNKAYVPPQIDTPEVVPSSGSGSGRPGIWNIHSLRPLRPPNHIRSYNRRSYVEAGGGYQDANHYDPELLWTGLGR